MKKRYLLVVLVLIFQLICSSFVYVQASDDSQSSICAGPSETMSLYFDFQNEMKAVLLGSRVNERRFSVYMGSGGLFSEQVLTLTKDTALDLVANSVWNRTRSLVSSSATTAVLLSLSTISVLQSNTEGLAILFRDRPIVRDYKTMLDIESELFDIAYFRSKQINLTRPVDGDLADQFKVVVNKYKDLGLLSGTAELKDVSMSNVIWDLVWMNAAMKHFIVYDAGGLNSFHGCMNKSKEGNCVAVIEFNKEAIAKLENDYKWTFGKCDSHFNSLISKTTKDSWKAGGQDVTEAMGRLKKALTVGWDWPWKKNRGCDISDYEMAQVRSYWGENWTCDDLVNFQASLPYYESKKSNQNLRKQQNGQDTSSKGGERSNKKANKKNTTVEKKQEWFYIYGTESEYSPEYSLRLNDDFAQIYTGIKAEYEQSLWNAQASDLSKELVKIRGLIDQLDGVISESAKLKEQLEKIANYQASN